ncbi:thioesterase family protein [Dermatophilaceae bacterium Sec6.4]
MSEFDDALRMDDADPTGTCSGVLSDDWKIGEAVNGGLLMALAAKAAATASGGTASGPAAGHRDPLSFSAVFLSPGTAGPVHLSPKVLRTGRSMSSAEVVVTQSGSDGAVERFRALVTLGDLDRHAAAPLVTTQPPAMPVPEACVSTDDAPSSMSSTGFLQRLDLRLDPVCAGWAVGAPSGQGEMRGWLRFADGREPDPLSLLLALDAFPPVVFDLGSTGWAPTVEFTGYVRARPAPGWLQVRTHTHHVAGGLFNEDCEIWDSTGTLVAQSRQLGSARFPTP